LRIKTRLIGRGGNHRRVGSLGRGIFGLSLEHVGLRAQARGLSLVARFFTRRRLSLGNERRVRSLGRGGGLGLGLGQLRFRYQSLFHHIYT
jgi:hypothetical protein